MKCTSCGKTWFASHNCDAMRSRNPGPDGSGAERNRRMRDRYGNQPPIIR